MNAELVRVPVPGADDLMALQGPSGAWVALKPLCDSLGIDTWAQQRRLNGRSWATTAVMAVVAADGKTREMVMVDSKTIPMWLATIDERRVSEEARPKLVAYQREAAAALDAHFNQRAVPAVAPLNQLDVLRAALDQIEAAQRDAAEAREIAERSEARLDGIEGRHDWFSALGYARSKGLPTYNKFVARLGKHAALIARSHGIEPDPVQHAHFGSVNSLPVWIWEIAAEGMAK